MPVMRVRIYPPRGCSQAEQECKARLSVDGVWHSLNDLCFVDQEKHMKIKASAALPPQETYAGFV